LVLYESGSTIKDRVLRVCQTFNGTCQEINRNGLEEQIAATQSKKDDTRRMIEQTRVLIREYLKEINQIDAESQLSLI